MKLEHPCHEERASAENSLLEGHVVKDRWQVVSKIGQGAFGQVYKCTDCFNNTEVALKLFCERSKQSSSALLKQEVQVLKDLKGKNFFPCLMGYGKTERFDYLVMELLGENLQQIRKKQTLRKFTLSSGVRLAQMMFESIRNMHAAGFVHRDIKPANFAIGLGSSARKLVIIDFSMARRFVTDDGDLIPPRRRVNYKGTPRYSSVNVLLDREAGRGDDLLSLFYSIYELIVDDLPWKREKDPQQLALLKTSHEHQVLLDSLPSEFCNFYEHIKNLRYEEEPDYQLLLHTFESIKSRRAIKDNEQFDFEMDERIIDPYSKSSPSTSEKKPFFSENPMKLKSSGSSGSIPSPEAQQGMPLSWSCPTFSLFIRSSLKPPLKQLASINESVFEVDVRRNVAAKQTDDTSLVDERRNSLPYVLGMEENNNEEFDEKPGRNGVESNDAEAKSMSVSENSKHSQTKLYQDNDKMMSSLSERVIEFLVEEQTRRQHAAETNPCQVVSTPSPRRQRINSENKYAKNESELNLQFKRRHRTFLSNDANNRILQILNCNESNFSGRAHIQETHDVQRIDGCTKRMRYRRAFTSAICT